MCHLEVVIDGHAGQNKDRILDLLNEQLRISTYSDVEWRDIFEDGLLSHSTPCCVADIQLKFLKKRMLKHLATSSPKRSHRVTARIGNVYSSRLYNKAFQAACASPTTKLTAQVEQMQSMMDATLAAENLVRESRAQPTSVLRFFITPASERKAIKHLVKDVWPINPRLSSSASVNITKRAETFVKVLTMEASSVTNPPYKFITHDVKKPELTANVIAKAILNEAERLGIKVSKVKRTRNTSPSKLASASARPSSS